LTSGNPFLSTRRSKRPESHHSAPLVRRRPIEILRTELPPNGAAEKVRHPSQDSVTTYFLATGYALDLTLLDPADIDALRVDGVEQSARIRPENPADLILGVTFAEEDDSACSGDLELTLITVVGVPIGPWVAPAAALALCAAGRAVLRKQRRTRT